MADKSQIEWTDATWNIITGCDIESLGCIHCYAMLLAGTRLRNHPSRAGLTKQAANGAHVWTGEVRFNEQWLDQPTRWTRPRNVFVCAHSDLFHPSVPDEWIDKIFAVMARAREHTYQVLTKRAKRMHDYLSNPDAPGRILKASHEVSICAMAELSQWPLSNVHVGVSVEDQQRANERIPWLLLAPAAVRWISAEPLIGPLDLRFMRYESGDQLPEPMRVNDEKCSLNSLEGMTTWPTCHFMSPTIKGKARIVDGELFQSAGESRSLDWVVLGGESGNNARPMNPEWARYIRDQCIAACVPFHFKQWGAWSPVKQPCKDAHRWPIERKEIEGGTWSYLVGKKMAGRSLDGRTWDESPRNN